MRKTFLYPALRILKKRNWSWITSQGFKYLAVKYLNRLWPEKIFVGPVMGVIVVSYRCNSCCPMCSLSQRGNTKKELSTADMEKLIDELAAIGTSGIGFTGGEPLLRTDIFHLIEYANDRKLVTTLNTNALLLDDEKITQLLEACPDNVNISLDAADGSTYDKLRGTKNGLDSLKRIVSLLVKQRNTKKIPMTLTAITTVGPGNIGHLKEIGKLAKTLGFDKVGFNPLHEIGKTTSCYSPELKGQDVYRQIIGLKKEGVILDNTDKFLRMFDEAFSGKPFPLRCLAGYTSLFVDCFGDVYFCWPDIELGKKIGNIQEERLSSLWRAERYAQMREKLKDCRNCFWNCQAELSVMFQ